MKVLICGEYGIFCKELIARLKKEKHDVYVITGSEKAKRKKPRDGVFQDYNFSFRSKSIRTVLKNIAPDCMIMLGACDVKFTWKDTNQESVRYLTGMTNLLMGAREVGIPNVIYCSTLGIFEETTIKDPEDVSYEELRRSAFCETMLQMNNICDEQNGSDDFRVKKIHFAEVYGDYGMPPYNFCNNIMEQYWYRDTLQIKSEDQHRVVYVNDAVDGVMRVLASDDNTTDYYVPGTIYTEKEIVNTVKKIIRGREVTVEESMKEDRELPNLSDVITAENVYKEKYSLKDGLEGLFKIFGKEKAYAVENEEKEPFIRRKVLPLVENIGLFLIVFMASLLLKDTWLGNSVNLYLFYVVLIAVVYGTNQALIGTVLVFAVKTLELLNVGNAFDYADYIDVLQVLIVGVIGGYMRDKYKRKHSDLEDEKKYFQSELVDMTKIYDGNMYVKSIYEKRLVNYENSMAKIYEIASRLDCWEPQRVIFQAVDVVKELMEMEDVAIYIAGKDTQYLRLMASSTERARSMGVSLRADEEDIFMRDELVEKVVYRNKDFESEKPSYACGVYAQDSLTAIVMVWTDDLTKINLYQSNMLALLCRLIEAAMNRARLYWNKLSDQYIEGTNILHEEGIDTMINLCKQGAKENKLVYELLKVPNSYFAKNEKTVLEKVVGLIRETDYMGIKDNELYIILMNANSKETDYVMKRFEKIEIPVEKVTE